MADTHGRYRLDDRLGQGGMGVVYRAFDTVLQRVVALKMVLAPGDLDATLRERFFREARSAAHLTHKNIVTIYDLGEHEGRPYIAMEFLDGEDLQHRLARPEKMSFRRKLDIAIEMCQGVDYAHAHGVIHRDLKPANIFVTATGGVKILDFGLARYVSSELTNSNMLMGTLNYMAPEQVRGERADAQSDVFSAGVVLYELFGGRRAFEGDSAASTLYKILQELPEPLWKIDMAIPRELTAVIDRAMAKLRDERYPDMATLRRDLETLRNMADLAGPSTPIPVLALGTLTPSRGVASVALSSPTVAAPGAQPPAVAQRPAPRPGFWAGVAAGGVILALIIGTMATRRDSPPPAGNAPRLAEPAPQPAPQPVLPPVTPAAETRTPAATAVSAEPAAPRAVPRVPKPAAAERTAPGELPRQPAVRVSAPAAAPQAPQPPVDRAGDARPVALPAAAPPPQPTPAPAPPVAPPPTPAVVVAPSAAPPVAATPVPVAATPAPAEAAPLSMDRANEVLRRYREALEAKSLDQLKRIWPTLSGAAEAAMRQEFQHAATITVGVSEPQVSAAGSTGRITFTRHYSLVTQEGRRLQNSTQVVMDVHRSGDTWLIDAIRFSGR